MKSLNKIKLPKLKELILDELKYDNILSVPLKRKPCDSDKSLSHSPKPEMWSAPVILFKFKPLFLNISAYKINSFLPAPS